MWVADSHDKKLYAYHVASRTRDPARDFDTLDGAGNDDPWGIWSDGDDDVGGGQFRQEIVRLRHEFQDAGSRTGVQHAPRRRKRQPARHLVRRDGDVGRGLVR